MRRTWPLCIVDVSADAFLSVRTCANIGRGCICLKGNIRWSERMVLMKNSLERIYLFLLMYKTP